MLSTPTTMCANHRKRGRVATCGVCNSALCIDCVVHTAVGVKCRKCTGGAAATSPTAAAKARGLDSAHRGDTQKKKKRWALPVAALGAALMVTFAAILVFGGDDKPKATGVAANDGLVGAPSDSGT